MGQQGQAVEALRDQPIWVQDLLAWLEKIQQQDLTGTGEELAKRVEEVLADLPGQELPEEFWLERKADGGVGVDQAVEAEQEEVAAELQRLNDEDRGRVQAELDRVPNIRDEHSKYQAFLAVATKIPVNEIELLQQVLTTVQNFESESSRLYGLGVVATKIPANEIGLLQQALTVAQTIESEEYRAKALGIVAAKFPASEPQLLQQALTVAQNFESEYYKSQALANLAAQLPASEPQLLQQVFTAAQNFESEYYQSPALANLAAQLPASEPQLLQQALTIAQNIGDEYHRSKALAAVAAQLPASERQPVLQQALTAAQNVAYENYRAPVLAAVAAQLPASERQPVLQQALTTAQNVGNHGNEEYRFEALVAVAAQLPASERQPVLQQALTTAGNIRNAEYRSKALAAVAAQLPSDERQPVLQQALTAARSTEYKEDQPRALAAIAAQLPSDERQPVFKQALTIAQNIGDEYHQSKALAAVAAQLPSDERQPVFKQALTIAQNIGDETHRSSVLAAVAAQLPASELQLLQDALTAAQNIKSEYYRSPALAAVVAQLPTSEPQLLQQALAAAQNIRDEAHRSSVLAAVAAQLPASEPQLLQQLIQIASAIETPEHRVTALRETAFRFTEALLLHAPQTLLATLLRIVPAGKTTADRARLLSALAPKLSPGLFPRALQLTQTEVSHPAYQAEILANLAPYLPGDLLSEALDLVRHHIPGYSYPTTALRALIPHLSLTQLQTALVIASERVPQPQLTSKILQAIATRLSDANCSRSTPDDLVQKDHLVQYLLKRIQQHINDGKSITTIITALAPSLNGDSLAAISVNVLPKLPSEFYRAQILSALATAPNLTAQQLTPFHEKATELSQAYPKATALSALIPHFPELHPIIAQIQVNAPNAIQATDLALILSTRPQTDDATDLSLLTADQTNALRLIRNQSRDPEKANSLINLAPYLRGDLLLEAQSVAQDIQNRYHQARSLLALASYFPEVRAEALTQISSLKAQAPIQHIELLSQYTITVPEQIPTLLKAVEDWAKNNPFKDDPKEPDPNTFKRRRILIALKPHLPLRLDREIDRQTGIGRAPHDLWERALFVLRTEYRRALKSGTIRNDAAQDSDLLNLKEEINALTEMLLMRDLEPPVTVGILGGWGGGKSYIMHLMQTHMVKVRSQGMEPIEAWGRTEGSKTPDHDRVGRFVGHIYQIKFDAWTYAKADLWSSLMQTIFFELDRQISLETALREVGINPLDSNSNEIWRVLYQTDEDDSQYFLEKVLGKEKLSELKEKNKEEQESWTTLLWKQYGITETDARNRLSKAEEQLDQVTRQLKKLEQEKTTLNKQLAPDKEPGNWFTGVLIETSSISGFLLSKYFGKEISGSLQTEIENRLKLTDIDTSDLNKINLFINQTVSEILDEDQIILPNGGKKYSLSWFALRKWANKNRQLIITVIILLGCAILGPLIAHWINPQNTIAQLSWMITPLIPAISLIQNLFKSHQKWLAQAQQSIQDYQVTLKERAENKFYNLISEKQSIELRKLDSDINKLRNQQKNLEQEITQAQNDLPADKFASLASFVNATVKGERYDRELGMMHKVKIDLSKLSQALLPPPHDSEEYKNKLNKLRDVFPRGPARVVLFIDDLDRCPPNTVVEVLEAVQLLVKNPLFIAVLAIDERYINRALAKHYKGVLSLQGRPSAADYLEKIIQIPYRIRPIDETALRSYLRAQVVVQDSETSGTKFNEFSPREFNLLVQCCQEAELSPRSLKRLTNVYKLYKVLSRTRGHRPTYREQKAILTLLTFSNRYADLMRDIIEEIGSHYEEGRHLLGRNGETETLANIINTYLYKYERLNPDSLLIQDVKKLRHDVKKLVDDDLELKDIRQIFEFVRSFSFVGDIGTDYTPSSIFSQTNANFGEGV